MTLRLVGCTISVRRHSGKPGCLLLSVKPDDGEPFHRAMTAGKAIEVGLAFVQAGKKAMMTKEG